MTRIHPWTYPQLFRRAQSFFLVALMMFGVLALLMGVATHGLRAPSASAQVLAHGTPRLQDARTHLVEVPLTVRLTPNSAPVVIHYRTSYPTTSSLQAALQNYHPPSTLPLNLFGEVQLSPTHLMMVLVLSILAPSLLVALGVVVLGVLGTPRTGVAS